MIRNKRYRHVAQATVARLHDSDRFDLAVLHWHALDAAFQTRTKRQTSIGKWKGIERVATDQKHLLEDSGARSEDDGDQPLLSGDMLVFDRGQKCWNGPARSLRVALACGPDDVLSAVEEPETCAYTAVLETPAACSADMKNVLLRGATGTRSAAKGDSEGTASDKFRSIDQGIEDEL